MKVRLKLTKKREAMFGSATHAPRETSPATFQRPSCLPQDRVHGNAATAPLHRGKRARDVVLPVCACPRVRPADAAIQTGELSKPERFHLPGADMEEAVIDRHNCVPITILLQLFPTEAEQ